LIQLAVVTEHVRNAGSKSLRETYPFLVSI
jgi:hypothetical protein